MKKFWAKLVAAWTLIRNQDGDWEGGQRWSDKRGRVGRWWGYGSVPGPIETNDLPSRFECIRKAQQFERNNAIVNRLVDVFEIYTVGEGGMPIVPASSDEEWNEGRKDLWDRWCLNPDLTSLQSFGTIQGLVARRWFADGRVLINCTRSDRAPFRPRVQLIEASRLKTPSKYSDNKNFIDGIEVDAKGRPIRYWICESGSNYLGGFGRDATYEEKFTPIKVLDYENLQEGGIIDVCEPMRPGEYHPFPLLAPVLNDIQDLNELCSLAMTKAKDSAKITNVFKTESGELPTDETVRLEQFGLSTNTAGGDVMEETRLRRIEQVLGSKSVAIKSNESVDQVGAGTPNQIEQAHWDIIVNRICAGVGISKLLVFPNSMQGTVVRADLDIANTFFRARSSVLQSAFRRVYEFVTFQEARFERAIADMPFDWRKCSIRPPRGCNVDVGRNSNAMIAEKEAGLRSLRSIYGELGFDWKEEVTQIAGEEAFIDRVSKAFKISPDRIRKSIGESLKIQLAEEIAANAKREEEEDAAIEKERQKQAA